METTSILRQNVKMKRIPKVKQYTLKDNKYVYGKEPEVHISKEQVINFYEEIMKNPEIEGFVAYLEVRK